MERWTNRLNESYAEIIRKENQLIQLHEGWGTELVKKALPSVIGGAGAWFGAPYWSDYMGVKKPETREEQKYALTAMGTLLPHALMHPDMWFRTGGEILGMHQAPKAVEAVTGKKPEEHSVERFATETGGTYLGGKALTALGNTIGLIPGLSRLKGTGPSVLGSAGFVGGDMLGDWAADKMGIQNPAARIGLRIAGGVGGDVLGTQAQARALPLLARAAAANPVAATIAAGTALGGAASYGINRAIGGADYANRIFQSNTWNPKTWWEGAKELVGANETEWNAQVDPAVSAEKAKQREEEYRKRLAQQKAQQSQPEAQQKPAAGSIQDVQAKLQGIYEGKLSERESLHRRLKKQRYKVSYMQDGKKVDVFASSIRGVRRVVYGKKQYRVHNSSGSDITGYFKKLLSR